jgi:hypothetical protein
MGSRVSAEEEKDYDADTRLSTVPRVTKLRKVRRYNSLKKGLPLKY